MSGKQNLKAGLTRRGNKRCPGPRLKADGSLAEPDCIMHSACGRGRGKNRPKYLGRKQGRPAAHACVSHRERNLANA